jgi:hypothetical protein
MNSLRNLSNIGLLHVVHTDVRQCIRSGYSDLHVLATLGNFGLRHNASCGIATLDPVQEIGKRA